MCAEVWPKRWAPNLAHLLAGQRTNRCLREDRSRQKMDAHPQLGKPSVLCARWIPASPSSLPVLIYTHELSAQTLRFFAPGTARCRRGTSSPVSPARWLLSPCLWGTDCPSFQGIYTCFALWCFKNKNQGKQSLFSWFHSEPIHTSVSVTTQGLLCTSFTYQDSISFHFLTSHPAPFSSELFWVWGFFL